MSDEQEQDAWERQEGEPNNWYSRFVLFLQLGPSRSLRKAIAAEKATKGDKEQQFSDVSLLSVPRSWFDASHQWNWRERAEAWDEHRRKQVFVMGNAYDVTRVEKLAKYSERLEGEIDKMLTSLENKKLEDIKKPWFNQFLYEKYLQSLEALAAETGGRVKKQEITGKDGGPLQTILCLPDNGDDEEDGDDSQPTNPT